MGSRRSEGRAAAFDLAKRLREPGFLLRLERLGWRSGDHIVPAADAEPVVSVLARMALHDTGSTAIVAVPDPREPFEFLLVRIEALPPGERRADTIKLGPGASFGMLCEALRPVATYTPSQWNRSLLCERVTA